jgi:hypothetical protein
LGINFGFWFKYAFVFTPTTTLVKRVLIFFIYLCFASFGMQALTMFSRWFGNKLGAEELQVFGLL